LKTGPEITVGSLVGSAVTKTGFMHPASLIRDLKSESALAEKVSHEIRRAEPPNL